MATYAGRYDEVLLRKAGNRLAPPAANTTVLVYQSDGSTTATLYTDRTKATTAANPVAVDASGNLEFFADPGTYVLAIREDGVQRATDTAVVHLDPGDESEGLVDSVNGKTGVVTLVKGDVGLGNVDNTSDVNKPVSSAQQTALDAKAPLASPALTGTPTVPTAAPGTNTTQAASTAFVGTAVDNATYLVARGAGIDPTGVADSTAALQALITEAQTTGVPLRIPAGTYKHTGLTTAESGTQPTIIGDGMRTTILNCTAAATPALTLVGGSGTLSGARIVGLKFTGAGSYGIEFRGCNFVSAERCWFDTTLAEGVRFHNFAASTFTEHCLARDCQVDAAIGFRYLITLGTDSFHGSGFDGDCVITQPPGATNATIIVGAGAYLYNAPWSGRLNVYSATKSPILLSTTAPPVLFGTLRVENFAGATVVDLLDPASSSGLYYGGQVLTFSQGIKIGTRFWLIDRAQWNSDGSVAVLRKPQQTNANATTGTTVLTGPLGIGDFLADVQLIGSNYTYAHLLHVRINQFGGTFVTTIATPEAFNAAGWGASTFAVNASGQLTVTNASGGFSATVNVGMTHLLGTNLYPLG